MVEEIDHILLIAALATTCKIEIRICASIKQLKEVTGN